MDKPKIFISSTYTDLKRYRREIEETIKILDSESISMEYFSISQHEPLEACLEKIDECEVFVGIYAFRYGFIPENFDKSITHLEFEYAYKNKKHLFVFFANDETKENNEYNAAECEKEKDIISKLNKFKELLGKGRVIKKFTTKQELGKYFAMELGKYFVNNLKKISEVDYLKEYPVLSEIGYPSKSPYIGLRNYSRNEARVFYGRSKVIWEVLKKLKETSSIILLHGHSGVGKSSIIEAGVAPRLERKGFRFLSFKRDKSRGLDKQLNETWEDIRNTRGEIVVSVDQIEECITDPRVNDFELNQFFNLLQEIKSVHENVKFILSFRQEFLADILENVNFKKHNFSYENINIGPMNQLEVLEAIRGVTSDSDARKKYSLTIEEDFAHELAYDLLQDSKSNLAPLLQGTLSKMWAEITREPAPGYTFNTELYRKVKSKSLADFITEQLSMAGKVFPELYQKGTLLEFLFFLTTDVGTSRVVSERDLKKRYLSFETDELLVVLEKYYLVRNITNERHETMYRLTHDSLGPIVRSMYLNSDLSVPRGYRIIESKDFNNTEAVLFTENEITSIKDVLLLGRNLNDTEKDAINRAADYYDKERENREKARKREKRTKAVLTGASIISFIALVVAFWFLRESEIEKAKGEAYSLAGRSDYELVPYGIRLLEKAAESNLYNQAVYSKLFEKFNSNDSIPFLCTEIFIPAEIVRVLVSHDSRHVVVLPKDKKAGIYTIQGKFIDNLVHKDTIRIVNIHADKDILATASDDGVVKVWNMEGRALSSFKNSLKVNNVFFGESTNELFVQDSVSVKKYELPAYNLIGEYRNEGKIKLAQYSKRTNELITVSSQQLILWNLRDETKIEMRAPDRYLDGFEDIWVSPNFRYLFKYSNWQRIYDLRNNLQFVRNANTGGSWEFVSASSKNLWVTSQGGISKLFDYELKDTTVIRTLGATFNANISPESKYLACVTHTGQINIFNPDGVRIKRIPFASGLGEKIVFSPDEKNILTFYKQHLRIWDIDTKLTVKIPTRIDQISPEGSYSLSFLTDTLIIYNSLGKRVFHKYSVLNSSFSPSYEKGIARRISPRFLDDSTVIYLDKDNKLFVHNLSNMENRSVSLGVTEIQDLFFSESNKYLVLKGRRLFPTLEQYALVDLKHLKTVSLPYGSEVKNLNISEESGDIYYSRKNEIPGEDNTRLPVSIVEVKKDGQEKVMFKLEGGNIDRIILNNKAEPIVFWDYRDTLNVFDRKGKVLSKLIKEKSSYPYYPLSISSSEAVLSKDRKRFIYFDYSGKKGVIWDYRKDKVGPFDTYPAKTTLDDFFEDKNFYLAGAQKSDGAGAVLIDIKGNKLYDFNNDYIHFFSRDNSKIVTNTNEIIYSPEGALNWLRKNTDRLPSLDKKFSD